MTHLIVIFISVIWDPTIVPLRYTFALFDLSSKGFCCHPVGPALRTWRITCCSFIFSTFLPVIFAHTFWSEAQLQQVKNRSINLSRCYLCLNILMYNLTLKRIRSVLLLWLLHFVCVCVCVCSFCLCLLSIYYRWTSHNWHNYIFIIIGKPEL